MASHAASGSRIRIQPISDAQQDEVIRKRVQIDEVKLRRLVKKLTSVLAAQETEALSIAQISFSEELEVLQRTLSRLTSVAHATSEVEIHSYRRELSDIEEQHNTTTSRIEMLKRRLEEVKLERKNKLEYDVVAAEIVQLPTRSELAESLAKLAEQLEQVHAENAKYASMSKTAAERMSSVADSISTLQNDIGYEVGERERREVERGDGEADAEPTDLSSRTGEPEEGEETEQRHSSTPTGSGSRTPRLAALESDPPVIALNPSAPVFQPNPASTTSTSTPRRSRPKRGSSALNGSDEEGELQDTSGRKTSANNTPLKNSNDDTPRKRQRHQE